MPEIQFADYIYPGLDQLVSEAARLRYRSAGEFIAPMTVRSPFGGGIFGGQTHSQSPEALFTHVAGLKTVIPSTPYDAKGLLKTSIRDDNPVIFIENKVQYATTKDEVPDTDYTVPFGVASVRRTGKDVTIIGLQRMVEIALEAADHLAEEGIEAEVIDPRTIVPLDLDTIIKSVKKTHRVVIVHEAHERVGFGAELVAQIVQHAFDYLDAPPARVANPNVPTPFNRILENLSIPSAAQVAQAVRGLMR